MAQLEITYCVQWDYLPKATSLAAEIKEEHGVETKLIPGSGGQFEVVLDGQLIFSKKKEHRFPSLEEIAQHL